MHEPVDEEQVTNGPITIINNMGFAAYLMLNGFQLIKPPYKNENGRFVFEISICESESKSSFFEYSKSRYADLNSILVNLKKMLG
jgi:hypothetical protein